MTPVSMGQLLLLDPNAWLRLCPVLRSGPQDPGFFAPQVDRVNQVLLQLPDRSFLFAQKQPPLALRYEGDEWLPVKLAPDKE